MSNDNNGVPLYMKYAPTALDDVYLHPKKVSDIRNILTNELFSIHHNINMLIISGPSGSCKTTLVKLLIDEYFDGNKLFYESLGIQNSVDICNYVEFDPLDKTTTFEKFLEDCKVFKKNSKMMKVVLVKYLPNIYYGPIHAQFLKTIKQYLNDDYDNEFPPIIFIVSECDIPKDDNNDINDNFLYTKFDINSHYIPETIFDKEILQNPRVKRVNMNPLAKTYLKKILKRVLEKELVHINSKIPRNKKIKASSFNNIIDQLSDMKDISSALLQLEAHLQAKKDSNDIETVRIDNRDTGISLFHAVGKIFYGTKEEGFTNDDIIKLLNKDYQQYTDSVFKCTIFENLDSAEIMGLDKYAEMVDVLSETDVMNTYLGTEAYIRKVRYLCTDLKERLQDADIKAKTIKFTPIFKIMKKIKDVQFSINDLQLLKVAKNGEYINTRDLILYENDLESRLLSHYYKEYQAWKEYRLDVGKSIEGINKPGNDIDPKIDYLDIIGGKLGTINSISDLEGNVDVFVQKRNRYKEYLKKQKPNETYMELKDSVDIPYDPNVDDFEIESSVDGSEPDSSSDEEELLLLASQQIEKEKKLRSQSRTSSPLKRSINIPEDTDDSDEELFQLTSQHLNKLQKK